MTYNVTSLKKYRPINSVVKLKSIGRAFLILTLICFYNVNVFCACLSRFTWQIETTWLKLISRSVCLLICLSLVVTVVVLYMLLVYLPSSFWCDRVLLFFNISCPSELFYNMALTRPAYKEKHLCINFALLV